MLARRAKLRVLQLERSVRISTLSNATDVTRLTESALRKDRNTRPLRTAKLLVHAFCLVVLTSLLLCRSAVGNEPKRVRVVVCSNEPALKRETFASELQSYLAFAEVEVSDLCLVPSNAEAFLARFVVSPNGGIRLQLETVHAPPRIRSLPWLEVGPPLGQTLRRAQVPMFAILLEAMLLEFERIQLLHAPPLPAATAIPGARAATPAIQSVPPEVPAPPDNPAASTPRTTPSL